MGILAGMQPGRHRDRIVEAIRISSSPLDDDQLADRTGISPRQRVNQICRELEHAGIVRRRPGPDGTIVNERLEITAGITGVIQPGHELPPGSSQEHRDAERVMLDLLSRQLGRKLEPAKLAIPSGERASALSGILSPPRGQDITRHGR